MDYNYAQTRSGMKFGQLEECEKESIRKEWDKQCARENINNPGYILIQRPSGLFFEAIQVRQPLGRYSGSLPGYWNIRLATCRGWGWSKTPFGTYYPEARAHYYSGYVKEDGSVVKVPRTLHTKKEVLEFAKSIEFEF